MVSWQYDTCDLCKGKGKIYKEKLSVECPICHGYGYWEFVSEENHLAVQALLTGISPEDPHVQEICNRRLAQITPDNIEEALNFLEEGITDEGYAFNAIQGNGATKWGWAWLHANRFAIELCRLCGGNSTKHRLGLSLLAWKWLKEEDQKKIDAPIDKPEKNVLS